MRVGGQGVGKAAALGKGREEQGGGGSAKS